MRKLSILVGLALIASTLSLHSQDNVEAPNYELIRSQITDSTSPNYYPRLMERFMQCDTTLELENYRALYYGFPLREDFIPYQEESDALLNIRRRVLQANCPPDSCAEIIEVAKKALANNPFDLTALTIIPLCYEIMADDEHFRQWDIKRQGIIDAIFSSGDGESPETAYHVINVEHEYELLNSRHLELSQVKVENMQTDFMQVRENADSIAGIYFNFSACSQIYKEKYK